MYEDTDTLAFLDIHPINPGHVLVIPKVHVPEFQDLDDEIYTKTMNTVKKMAQNLTKLEPKRIGLKVEGWDVSHAHIHVVPLLDPHDITSKRAVEGTLLNPTKEELEAILLKLTT